jgi:pimeloyl-ACP methyl ester carboxylesterase
MTSYRTTDVQGNEVFYREAGDPSAKTLLLLHGFPSSSAQFDVLMGLLERSVHVIAPDYPGFGQSPPLAGATTFDGVADVMDAFTRAKGLQRFSMYMFDFGSPVGFRLATRDPGRVEGLVLQNGNAYNAGLGPGMQALEPYWADRDGKEAAIRTFLTREVTRSQYLDGVADTASVNPDLWELDQRYLELPGRDAVMLDLLYDYRSNVELYPTWQEYLRVHRPPVLAPWGRNDAFFPVAGATAYLSDAPDTDIHLLDTGHFATATHSAQIAALIEPFLRERARPGAVTDQMAA